MNADFYVVNVEAAIFNDDGKWLVAKRSDTEDHAPGVFSMVGGKVEGVPPENSVLEETLKREIREEVGVEIFDDVQYVKSSSFIADSGEHVLDIVFLCRYKSGEAKALDLNELTSVAWMSINEILSNEAVDVWTKKSLTIAEKMRK